MKYIHGSENSLDIDVMYVMDILPPLNECKIFCSDKNENRNIITIENGIVSSCYKGTPDECNNSLFRTYNLHKQSYPLLVERTVERDITLKAIRALRGVLSHMSRSSYRPQVKSALKNENWFDRIETLNNIDISIIDFDNLLNNMSGKDILKLIAFQCAQTLALSENIEIYTKNEVCKYYPDLTPFINRENGDISILQSYIKKFCELCKSLDVSNYNIISEYKLN